MLSIVMDTSNQYLAVALYQDGVCLEAHVEQGSRRQSENAIPVLDVILKKHGVTMREVDEMIITRGPGSYTGVRVAMTIAKTLAVISPVAIKTVSSLAAYAGYEKAISVIDARSRKVFVGMYENGQAVMADTMMTLEAFHSFYAKHQDYILRGQDGVVGDVSAVPDLCGNIYRLAQQEEACAYPDALVPVYLKDVEAKKLCA